MKKYLGKITRKYLNQQFEECNCLQLIYNIYKDAGHVLTTFETEYKGHNVDNYMPHWENNPDQAIKDMIDVLEITGQKADPKFLKPWDIVVVECNGSKFPAIYTGYNTIMAATKEKGVIMIPVSQKFKIIMVRRVF